MHDALGYACPATCCVVQQTCLTMQQYFCWCGVQSDAAAFVWCCDNCQRRKLAMSAPCSSMVLLSMFTLTGWALFRFCGCVHGHFSVADRTVKAHVAVKYLYPLLQRVAIVYRFYCCCGDSVQSVVSCQDLPLSCAWFCCE
jgi:hypothetical protein